VNIEVDHEQMGGRFGLNSSGTGQGPICMLLWAH